MMRDNPNLRRANMKSGRALLLAWPVWLIWATSCLASGGKVTFQNGTPVPGAKVQVMKDGKDVLKLTTDPYGGFLLPDLQFENVFVQISAPGGAEYATVTLPVKMFLGNGLTVVLHPNK